MYREARLAGEDDRRRLRLTSARHWRGVGALHTGAHVVDAASRITPPTVGPLSLRDSAAATCSPRPAAAWCQPQAVCFSRTRTISSPEASTPTATSACVLCISRSILRGGASTPTAASACALYSSAISRAGASTATTAAQYVPMFEASYPAVVQVAPKTVRIVREQSSMALTASHRLVARGQRGLPPSRLQGWSWPHVQRSMWLWHRHAPDGRHGAYS